MDADQTNRSPFWAARPRLTGAIAAVLMVLATVAIFVGEGLVIAGPWVIDNSRVEWITGLDDGLPYRPQIGVEPGAVTDWSVDAPDTTQISHDFQLAPGELATMALLLPMVNGEAALFVNGVPAEERVTSGSRYLAVTGDHAVMWAIPPHLQRPGPNRLDLIIAGSRYRSLRAPLVLGPPEPINHLFENLSSLTFGLRGYLLMLSALAAGLALTAAATLRAPTPWLPLSAAAAAVGARGAASDLSFSETLGPYWPLLDETALCAALICLGCAFIGKGEGRSLIARRWLAGGAALLTAVTLLALYGSHRGAAGFETAGLALPLFGMAFLIWAGREALKKLAPVTTSARTIQGAVLAVVALTTTVAVVAQSGLAWGLWVTGLEAAYGIGIVTLLRGQADFAALMSGRVLWRWVRDRPRLSRIIRSQQEEIEATALALRQQERWSAVLEERQRLSRDMHDGIGGQLMSLLARVRSRRISPEQMEGELTSGLAELRLMVDSLDASDGPVADALAVLRSRIRTQTEAARMSLDWSQSEGLNDIVGEPNWVLNLNRLIQEAVTNAVRHANADHLSVAIEVVDDRRLAVTIRDNGVGFDRDRVQPGRGLTNLAFRAAQMGGAIEIGRDGVAGGAIVRAVVTIPQAQPALPAPRHQSSEDIMPS